MEEKCPVNGNICNKLKFLQVNDITNGIIKSYNCCGDCFSPLIVIPTMPFNTTFVHLIHNLAKLKAMEDISQIKCTCGYSLEDIKRISKAGCANCYNIFKEEFKNAFPKMHNGANSHVGKSPRFVNVEKQLEKAIQEERYEDAAKLRDLKQTVQRNDFESPDKRVQEDII